ncbi:MAG: EamA family transporter [Acidobacteria bacterium]|nr:EamA family transporter [Acidobacteriota bacterium]
MKSSRLVRIETYVLLSLMVWFGALGNILLSKGMKQIGALNDWSAGRLATISIQMLTSGALWLGVLCLLLFFVSNLLLLSWADYSYVMPASASGYALVALLGYAFLGETVTPLRWLGVGLICLGVVLVDRTPLNTTGNR